MATLTLAEVRQQVAEEGKQRLRIVCPRAEARRAGADSVLLGGQWYRLTPTALQALDDLDDGLLRWHVHDGRVRAVLPFDQDVVSNDEVVGAVQDALVERVSQVVMFHLDERSLHLRIVFPEQWRRLHAQARHDLGCVGFHVSYREAEDACVTLGAILWREICTNGAYGITTRLAAAEARGSFLSSADRVGGIRCALQSLSSDADRMAGAMLAASTEPDPDMSALIELLDMGMPAAFAGMAMHELQDHSAITRFDIINALTAAARAAPDPDERLEMEAWGARLLAPRPARRAPEAKEVLIGAY